MTRSTRALLGAAALGAAMLLTGCGAAAPNAASIDDVEISRSDFQGDLDAVATAQAGGSGSPASSVSGELARGLLTTRIIAELLGPTIDEQGIEVTDEIRAEADQFVSGQYGGLEGATREALVEALAEQQAYVTGFEVDEAQVEADYDTSPASAGTLCLRHILVGTEEEAEAVLAELEDGADFAELAAERSTEPAAPDTGGALADQDGSPCIPLPTYESGFDPAFVDGAKQAVPGEPFGPVQSSFGWHVIQARDFDEVGGDVVADARRVQAIERFRELASTADITVDPRYGRWDGEATSVVPLGS